MMVMSPGNPRCMASEMKVYAVGKDPLDAFRALNNQEGFGETVNIFVARPRPGWGWAGYVLLGTSKYEGGGHYVPGGAVLCWWRKIDDQG